MQTHKLPVRQPAVAVLRKAFSEVDGFNCVQCDPFGPTDVSSMPFNHAFESNMLLQLLELRWLS